MVVGLAADGDVDLPDLDLADGPLVLVVGSEGKGLSRLVAETCDQLRLDPDGQPAGVAQRRRRRGASPSMPWPRPAPDAGRRHDAAAVRAHPAGPRVGCVVALAAR